jgi:hypothetical protein
MRIKKFIILLIFSELNVLTYSQDWIRIYQENFDLNARWIIESYDHGYLILASASDYQYTYILKTDINGYILWDKFYGEGNYHNVPVNIEQTIDSGYIVSGTIGKYGTYDAYILKLNPCFEMEWCKVLNTNNEYPDYARRIKPLPEGGFLLLTAYYEGITPGTRIHLHKFDSSGELLWQNAYANSDSSIFNEEGFDISLINENEYLITGTCYYPDSGQTGGRVRPFLIKSDSSGYPIWENPWNIFDTYWGKTYNSAVDNSGNSFSVGYRIGSTGQYPAMIKTSPGGQELSYSDLVDTANYGQGQTITFMEDSNLFVAAGWKNNDQSTHNGLLKVDTSGIVNDFKELFDVSNALISTARTFDNKFITVGIHYDENLSRWVIYAFKVNSDLEYDSIYTTPFVYDSVCPYNIPSDTTDLDCDLLVNIEDIPTKEEYESTLKISPNPARDWIMLSLPDNVHDGIIDLAIYNLFGQEILKKEVTAVNRTITVNISSLSQGLYVAVFKDRQNRILKGKFIVVGH